MDSCKFNLSSTVKFPEFIVGDNKPCAYICSKGCFAGLSFGEAYFRRGLLLEGILRFRIGWALQ